MSDRQLLRIEDLVLHFRTERGTVRAVDGVNFNLGYNEAVVILGESGCGKPRWQKPSCACCPVMWKHIRGECS